MFQAPSFRRLSQIALAALGATALSTVAMAQSAPRVIGLTRNTPVVLSQDVGTCATAVCPVALPPPSGIAGFVGGTCVDPRDRGVFVSNGLLMAKIDPRSTACAPLCPVLPVPNTTPNNPVTGLAYNESTNILYITDGSNVIRWYSVGGGCQLSLIFRCLPPIGAGEVLTGCATDDLNGLIFYSTALPGTPGGRVYVAPQTNPCAVICVHFIANCGTLTMGPLVGLAFDSCARVLYATDGRVVVGHQFNSITCAMGPQVQCCINTFGDPYVGLCLLPSTETSNGPNCTATPCPACPSMTHDFTGDPTLGNPTFSLDLSNAPGGTVAWLVLNVGPCAGPGVFAPPLCAPLLVPFAPPWLTIGPIGTGGAVGTCTGNVNLNVAIPMNPLLCGFTLSTQYLGYCGAGGFFVSNCLSWTIGTS